jgi:hypothetical protein
MTRLRLNMLFALAISGCFGITALAQAPQAGGKQPNVAKEKGKEGAAAQAVALLRQAGDLVHYARENESPVAMLAAVEILERVQVKEASDKTKPEAQPSDEKVKEGTKGHTEAATLDPQKLLSEAKPWAQQNPHVLALIDAEAAKSHGATSTLGAYNGAIIHYDRVLAGYRDTWKIVFRAGEIARVAVVGDGDTGLDLYVFDANGNLITKDDDSTANAVVAFTPYITSEFRIVVVNRGGVYNNYMLATN